LSIFKTIFQELFGIEEGLVKTVKDLRQEPPRVLKSYLKKERIYTSPVRMFFSVYGLVFIVIAFLINWKEVFINIFISLQGGMARYFSYRTLQSEKGIMLIQMAADYFDTIFSNGFVPMLLVTTLTQNVLVSKKLKKKNLPIDFKTFSYANFYAKSFSSYAFLILFPVLFNGLILLNKKADPLLFICLLIGFWLVARSFEWIMRKYHLSFEVFDFFPEQPEVKRVYKKTTIEGFLLSWVIFWLPVIAYFIYEAWKQLKNT
jgi:hypothetical protein